MLRSLVVSRFVKILFYVKLRLCYCYSALCLKLIQTWGTLVLTGKDDNVSGFSECEILDVGDTCGCEAACLPTDWRTRMSSLGQTIKLFISAVSIRLLFSSRHNNNMNAFTFSI